MPVVSDANCNLSYGPGIIIDHMICAGGQEGKDSCQVRVGQGKGGKRLCPAMWIKYSSRHSKDRERQEGQGKHSSVAYENRKEM